MSERARPTYLWMLAGILVLYTVIIGFGSTDAGGPARVAVLGFLVWNSTRLQNRPRVTRAAVVVAVAAVLASALTAAFGTRSAVDAVVGACSVLLITTAVWGIVARLIARFVVDASTVLGVLCIYLLFALFFADLHQFFAAFSTDYLTGTGNPPSPSDLLYYSVITLATVGFGDITPASEVARAVTVVEALVGQLYLVSVVAGVVGGWRGRPAARQ